MEQQDSRNGAPIAEIVVIGIVVLQLVAITIAAICLW
jgi:hypothetical protein